MAKLFVAVVPNSECEENVKRLLRTFDDCESKVKEFPEERDCNYYEMDCSKHPYLADFLCENLANGKYAKLGPIIAHNPLMKSVYGYYRACVKDDDYTLEQFINTED